MGLLLHLSLDMNKTFHSPHQRSLRFYFKKNIVIQKISKSSIELRIDDLILETSTKGLKEIFKKKLNMILHFIGNFMLNSDSKTIFENIKIYKSDG